MMSQPTRVPSLVTYISATQRRARSCPNLTERAVVLWRQGIDTAEITEILNDHDSYERGYCLLTEAVVAGVIARWRDTQAGRK